MSEKSDLSVFFSQSVGSSGTLGALLGPDSLLVRTDTGEPPRSAIGLFRLATPPQAYTELLEALKQLQNSGHQSAGQDPPGTPMLHFGLTESGATTAAWSSPAGSLPAEIQPAVKLIRQLIEQTLDHPELAVQARAAWQGDPFAAGQDLGAALVVRNIGGEPVVIVNPAAGGAVSGVELTLVRSRTPQQTGDVTFHAFGPQEVRQLAADGVTLVDTPGPTLELGVGAEVAFSLRKTIRLTPGDYRADLSLVITPAGDSEGTAIAGTTTMTLAPVTISR